MVQGLPIPAGNGSNAGTNFPIVQGPKIVPLR